MATTKRSRSRVALPKFAEPMKARLVERPPPGEWLYEVKLDGFRALALLGGSETKLVSRNDNDFATRFPEVVEALESFEPRDTILDGEVVALLPDGRSSFGLLADRDGNDAPRVFYVFDVLRYAGRDVTELPIEMRKEILAAHRTNTGLIRLSEALDAPYERLIAEARKLGLEGLIGKKKGSGYEVGKRTGTWVKLKLLNEQELVIGGYTDPTGSRSGLGALLVGAYDGKELRYAGKVGSGYTAKTLRELAAQLGALERKTCPFADLPELPKPGAHGTRMTKSEMKKVHWVSPTLVAQVRFTEWTRDGHLRHPVYLGLRPDKNPKDVVRETPDR